MTNDKLLFEGINSKNTQKSKNSVFNSEELIDFLYKILSREFNGEEGITKGDDYIILSTEKIIQDYDIQIILESSKDDFREINFYIPYGSPDDLQSFLKIANELNSKFLNTKTYCGDILSSTLKNVCCHQASFYMYSTTEEAIITKRIKKIIRDLADTSREEVFLSCNDDEVDNGDL